MVFFLYPFLHLVFLLPFSTSQFRILFFLQYSNMPLSKHVTHCRQFHSKGNRYKHLFLNLVSFSPLTNVAPCTPQITGACLDCFTNTVLMQWTYSEGATKYIATAESKDKDTALCNSTHTSCEILDLECGQLYSVTVVALNDRCNSSQSISQDIESGKATSVICLMSVHYVHIRTHFILSRPGPLLYLILFTNLFYNLFIL